MENIFFAEMKKQKSRRREKQLRAWRGVHVLLGGVNSLLCQKRKAVMVSDIGSRGYLSKP
jgi:hypothetical protein